MDLQRFIAKTLTEICKGVEVAQKRAGKTGAIINPQGLRDRNEGAYYCDLASNEPNHALVEFVNFDVALSATSSSLAGGNKGRLRVAAIVEIEGASGSKVENASGTVNRIQFKIPIVMPRTPSDPAAIEKRRIENDRANKRSMTREQRSW